MIGTVLFISGVIYNLTGKDFKNKLFINIKEVADMQFLRFAQLGSKKNSETIYVLRFFCMAMSVLGLMLSFFLINILSLSFDFVYGLLIEALAFFFISKICLLSNEELIRRITNYWGFFFEMLFQWYTILFVGILFLIGIFNGWFGDVEKVSNEVLFQNFFTVFVKCSLLLFGYGFIFGILIPFLIGRGLIRLFQAIVQHSVKDVDKDFISYFLLYISLIQTVFEGLIFLTIYNMPDIRLIKLLF